MAGLLLSDPWTLHHCAEVTRQDNTRYLLINMCTRHKVERSENNSYKLREIGPSVICQN